MPKLYLPVFLTFFVAAPAFAGGSWRPSYYGGRYAPPADLIVRADLLTVGFALRKLGNDPAALLAQVQTAVDDAAKRLQPIGATVRMRGLSLDSAGDKQSPETRSLHVDGSIEVPLPPDADFWTRARLQMQVLAALKPLVDDKKLNATVERPAATLRDPEPYRAELVKKWVDRERGFATAAQTPNTPLVPLGCQPPGPITQVPLGLDDVGLSLPLSCRLDAPPK